MLSYKEKHQRFMSGHTGTSFHELVLLFSAVCLSVSLRDAFLLWTCHRSSGWLSRFITDFGFIVVPSLLIMTLFSNSTFFMYNFLTLFTFILFIVYIFKKRWVTKASSFGVIKMDQRRTFITKFRSIVNLLTALAILGVDFQVFPRKLAKTEEFGYGMMDFGVGFFVISNAIVSPEARGKENSLPKSTQMKKAIVGSLPLFILGLLRLISVKGSDYHEHVTEYGVHWNFFFTLAALKVFSTMLFCTIPYIKPGITGIILLVGHQYCMSAGLSNYVINGLDGMGGRTSLIDANREGIFSLPGYIALYMMGVQLGRFLFIHRANLWEWSRAAVYLFVMVIGMVFLNQVLHFKVQMVSRRFVNAAYVISTMIFSYIALIICLVGDIVKTYCISISETTFPQGKNNSNSTGTMKKGQIHSATNSSKIDVDEKPKKETRISNAKESCLIEAINFNSLLFFLVANLMTGFVNMSMSTISANTLTAMAVLGTYSFLLCLLFCVLYSNNVKIKFW